MFPPLDEIKRRRKMLGITQAELAKRAEVSQSLLAKIEAKKAEPSYAYAKKIFEALNLLEAKNGVVARDIMNRHVVTVQKSERVSCAIDIMKKFNVSQLPVMCGDVLSGSISEKSILDWIAGGKSDISSGRIEQIMDEAYPSVGESTPLSTVVAILQHNQAIVVKKKEFLTGIITRADIFKALKA